MDVSIPGRYGFRCRAEQRQARASLTLGLQPFCAEFPLRLPGGLGCGLEPNGPVGRGRGEGRFSLRLEVHVGGVLLVFAAARQPAATRPRLAVCHGKSAQAKSLSSRTVRNIPETTEKRR